MKTKNILKIAIFGIALFALLISPVLKFATPQAEAESECEVAGGVCINARTDCPSGYTSSGAAGFKCDPIGLKCCLEDTGTISIRRGTATIKSNLPKERPESFCKKDFHDGMLQCEKRYGWGTTGRIGCEFKVVIADIWCTITVAILDGLGKMFAGLINLEIEWILWALDPGTYGGFAKNEGVIQIWEIMRNLVNSLLVLGLIGIAIATILGYKKYAWKQILWKLILVALLVNFSLVIAGTVVDISNYLSGYFLSIAQEENDTLAPRIQKGFGYVEEKSNGIKTLNPADIFDEKKYELPKILGFETINKLEEKITEQQIVGTLTPPEAEKNMESYDLRFGNFFIISFIMVLVGGFAVISLLAIFLTIVFRAFILIVLLGLSPIVFASWIFPDTEKYWKMWWSNFIKWCFFPAIFSFVLYIAVIAMGAMNKVSIGADPATQTIIQMVLFSMFLVGGLIFSIQSGGVVSKTVMQQSSKIGAAAGAFLGHKALKGAASSETWRKAQKRLEDSKFAPTHDIGVWMGRQPGKIRAAELKQIEENYKNQSDDQIRHDREVHKNDRARVAVATNALIERNKIDYAKDSESIKIARNQSNLNVPGLKKVHPELYFEHFTKPEDMLNEITKIESRYPGIPKDQAKNRVITNLMVDQVIKSSPDNIKSGNWTNIFDQLEKKGETDKFFGDLLDRDLKDAKLAAMINSLDDTDKQTEFINRFTKSVMNKINTTDYKDVIEYLKGKGYRRNSVLRAAFDL